MRHTMLRSAHQATYFKRQTMTGGADARAMNDPITMQKSNFHTGAGAITN